MRNNIKKARSALDNHAQALIRGGGRRKKNRVHPATLRYFTVFLSLFHWKVGNNNAVNAEVTRQPEKILQSHPENRIIICQNHHWHITFPLDLSSHAQHHL